MAEEIIRIKIVGENNLKDIDSAISQLGKLDTMLKGIQAQARDTTRGISEIGSGLKGGGREFVGGTQGETGAIDQNTNALQGNTSAAQQVANAQSVAVAVFARVTSVARSSARALERIAPAYLSIAKAATGLPVIGRAIGGLGSKVR